MSRLHQRLHRSLMLAATVALLFSLAVYLIYAINLIPFPFDYDQGEGFELHDTTLFSRGQLPYRDTNIFPFYASNYPPFYHILLVPFVWIFGPAFWYGRLLSFLASLATTCAIGLAVYRDGNQRPWIACLAGLAFLASNVVYHNSPLFRQHTLMVTLETLAVLVLARAWPLHSRRGIAVGLLLLICAGYTKQLAAITACAAFAWMFLRQPRTALPWALGFIAAGGLVFLCLQWASEGQWWTQAIVANVNAFDPWQAIGLFVLWFKLHGFLLVAAALLLAYETYCDRLSIYAIWFLFASILGGIASGTWGAGDSYFTTSIAAMCILSGIFLSRILERAWIIPRPFKGWLSRFALLARIFPLAVPLVYLGYACATLKMPVEGAFTPIAALLNVQPNTRRTFYDSASFDVPGYANIGYLLTEDDAAAGRRVADMIRRSDKLALTEDAGFAIAAGREVIANPTQLRNLHLAGLFDGDALIQMIDAQEFGLIVLRAQFYPPPALEAIGRSYSRRQTIRMNEFDYLILRPKASPSRDEKDAK